MKRVVILFLLLFFICNVCSAETNEWKDKSYDWSKVKTILVFPVNLSSDVSDPFALQKITDILTPELSRVQLKLMSLNEYFTQLGVDNQIDLIELNKTNPQKCKELIQASISKYADVSLFFNVYQMGWTKEYKPPRSFTYTTYQHSTITSPSSGVVGWVRTPVQNQVNVLGGYADFPTAAIGIMIYDTKTTKLVYGYTDMKKDRSSGFLGTHSNTPEDNMKDLILKMLDKLPFVKKK